MIMTYRAQNVMGEHKKTQSEQKERNHKDQIRNKLKRNEGNNSKHQ